MTTYPQENFNKSFIIPQEKNVAVIVIDMHVMIILDSDIIILEKSLKTMVNKLSGEQNVQFSEYTSYRRKHKNKTVFEIYKLPDGSVRLISKKYGVNAIYDGQNIRLEVSRKKIIIKHQMLTLLYVSE
jgi:hypothetical protein